MVGLAARSGKPKPLCLAYQSQLKTTPMTLTNHVFVTFLFLSLISSCQLTEVHVVPEAEPTFSGYYHLKTKFRGATESLDDGQGTAKVANGGLFMNLSAL